MTGTVISFNRISVIRICDKRFFLFFDNVFILSDLISAPQVGFETEEYMIIPLESRTCTIRFGISSSAWLSGPFPESGQVFRVQFQFPLLPVARIQCIICIYRK